MFFAHGIRPTEPVAVYLADSVNDLILYIALTSIGAVPVLTNGAMPHDIAAGYFQRVGVTGIVTDAERHAALAESCADGALKCVLSIDDPPSDAPALPSWFPFRHDADDPVMITHTSGTTGFPKAVVLHHGKWFHGIRQLLSLDSAQGADRYLSSLPASHNASIAYSIHAILNGAELMIMSSRRGQAVAEAISRFHPSTVVSFPQTYVELAQLDLDRHDLSSVTTWINSGDAAHEAHIRRLVQHGYHYRGAERVAGSQFVDGLGSSEMGHSSFRIIHTKSTDNYERCVGIPQTWVEAAVLDDEGNAVPASVIGKLGVRSPSVTPGYWNDSLTTYRSRVRGYWLTGDLVYRDHLGCYYHLDRASDVVPTSDGPLYSLQTEELVLRHCGDRIADCTVIGIRADGTSSLQEPLLLFVARDGQTVDAAALLEEINAVQAARGRPRLARAISVRTDDIPVGVTGKVLKRALRERFAAAQ
jgi:acyl-coenzyme A synthetase/AMP-(fatty) acid ligase